MTDRLLLDAHAVIQHLLGCRWGRGIATPDDLEPCPEVADQIVVLHGGPKEIEVRLCARHVERIKEETTPHEEVAGDH